MRGTIVLTFASSTILLPTGSLMAEDYYPVGTQLFYNVSEHASLQAHCDLLKNGALNCNISRVSVRPHTTEEDLRNRLNKIEEQLKNPINANDCRQFRQLLTALETRTPPRGADVAKFNETMSLMQGKQWEDFVTQSRSVVRYCESPSAQTLRELILTEHEKDKRTCDVGVQN
jgi:hypothetical protein